MPVARNIEYQEWMSCLRQLMYSWHAMITKTGQNYSRTKNLMELNVVWWPRKLGKVAKNHVHTHTNAMRLFQKDALTGKIWQIFIAVVNAWKYFLSLALVCAILCISEIILLFKTNFERTHKPVSYCAL